jgi:hypothetical protein
MRGGGALIVSFASMRFAHAQDAGQAAQRPPRLPGSLRLYVPSLEEATHPRCAYEGYSDVAGQSLKQGG